MAHQAASRVTVYDTAYLPCRSLMSPPHQSQEELQQRSGIVRQRHTKWRGRRGADRHQGLPQVSNHLPTNTASGKRPRLQACSGEPLLEAAERRDEMISSRIIKVKDSSSSSSPPSLPASVLIWNRTCNSTVSGGRGAVLFASTFFFTPLRCHLDLCLAATLRSPSSLPQ